MTVKVCADCGKTLGNRSGEADYALCGPCKLRLINAVNTPAMDRFISWAVFTAAIGIAIWLFW